MAALPRSTSRSAWAAACAGRFACSTPSVCRWSGPRSSFPRNERQSGFGAVAAYPKARMHELQITERILDVVLKHATGQDVSKVVRIHLRIGALSDLEDEWIQHYFDYLSRGTVAENAQLAITRTGAVLCCRSCSCSFEVTREQLGHAHCPDCGETGLQLVTGREYVIENMEVLGATPSG